MSKKSIGRGECVNTGFFFFPDDVCCCMKFSVAGGGPGDKTQRLYANSSATMAESAGFVCRVSMTRFITASKLLHCQHLENVHPMYVQKRRISSVL